MVDAGKKKTAARGNRSRAGKRKRATPDETSRPGMPIKRRMPEIGRALKEEGSTTKFICKVCGGSFDGRDALNEHLAGLHHPKRAVTASDIVNGVFEGRVNFPKTKAEIVRYVEENKDRDAVTPKVIDIVRNMPDKLYFTEADFVYGIEQTIR